MSLDVAPAPPAPEQLAPTLRECYEAAVVGSDDGLLICALRAGHEGFLHWDAAERIWWCEPS